MFGRSGQTSNLPRFLAFAPQPANSQTNSYAVSYRIIWSSLAVCHLGPFPGTIGGAPHVPGPSCQPGPAPKTSTVCQRRTMDLLSIQVLNVPVCAQAAPCLVLPPQMYRPIPRSSGLSNASEAVVLTMLNDIAVQRQDLALVSVRAARRAYLPPQLHRYRGGCILSSDGFWAAISRRPLSTMSNYIIPRGSRLGVLSRTAIR